MKVLFLTPYLNCLIFSYKNAKSVIFNTLIGKSVNSNTYLNCLIFSYKNAKCVVFNTSNYKKIRLFNYKINFHKIFIRKYTKITKNYPFYYKI